MSEIQGTYVVRIHDEGEGQSLWAEVDELPGCFASGRDMDELREALAEAISLYLSDSSRTVHVEVRNAPGSVTEQRMLVTC
jgi:predicted RNase H-like HicB family nuclease